MVSASQIREVVAMYLSHNDSDRFVLEFSKLSYNIHKDGDAEAVALAQAIEFKMADLRSGCISHANFRDSLRVIATAVGILSYALSYPITTSATNMPTRSVIDWPVDSVAASSIQFGDRRSALVY